MRSDKVKFHLKIISNNGIASYPNLFELEKNIYKNQGKVINEKIISHIRENNNQHMFILEAMSNSHFGDAIIYNSPVLINRHHLIMPIFSRLYYGSLLNDLRKFDIDESKLQQSKMQIINEIDRSIALLSKDKLIKLFKFSKVKYLISKNNYSFMTPVVVENNYLLYDLEVLVNSNN